MMRQSTRMALARYRSFLLFMSFIRLQAEKAREREGIRRSGKMCVRRW